MTAQIRRIALAVFFCLVVSGTLSGIMAAATTTDERRNDADVVVTFTKWVTISPGYPIMAGVTGGAAAGTFSGEVFEAKTTADGLVTRLVAVYEVHAGPHSFRALIDGGTDDLTGKAILDGVVLAGWMTGAKAHVRFDTVSCSEPNALNGTCFRGTIRLAPGAED